MVNKEAGMYFLGTFAGQQAHGRTTLADLDFFPFPTLGTEFDARAGHRCAHRRLHAEQGAREPRGRQDVPQVLRDGRRPDRVHRRFDTNDVSAANDADTSGYNPIQAKSAEIIGDLRSHRPVPRPRHAADFAGPNGMQALLQNFLNDPDQDLDAYPAGIQDAWDTPRPLAVGTSWADCAR